MASLHQLVQRVPGPGDYAALLSQFPDWQRLLFVHVPKCGGTSIRYALAQDALCAPIPAGAQDARQATRLMASTRTADRPPGRRLGDQVPPVEGGDPWQQYLATLVAYREMHQPSHAFLVGHRTARELLPLKRDEQDVFIAAVRDPSDILRSFVAFRVSHVLMDSTRPDSSRLLQQLRLDPEQFTALVRKRPRKLTRMILEISAPSVARYLALDERVDAADLWEGIRAQRMLLCHVSEQAPMLSRILDRDLRPRARNTSSSRTGLSARFSDRIEAGWVEPFVDSNSVWLQRKLEDSDIFGLWKAGGSIDDYLARLR